MSHHYLFHLRSCAASASGKSSGSTCNASSIEDNRCGNVLSPWQAAVVSLACLFCSLLLAVEYPEMVFFTGLVACRVGFHTRIHLCRGLSVGWAASAARCFLGFSWMHVFLVCVAYLGLSFCVPAILMFPDVASHEDSPPEDEHGKFAMNTSIWPTMCEPGHSGQFYAIPEFQQAALNAQMQYLPCAGLYPPMMPPYYAFAGCQNFSMSIPSYAHHWLPSTAPRCGESGSGINRSAARASGPITGRVMLMACDPHACRTLQDAFDQADGKPHGVAVAEELKGHVWEAIQDKNANHVVQKFIVSMSPDASQFIIDEIMAESGNAWNVARHCFGCRVVERLLEHCRKQQVEGMVVALLEDAESLCKHQYGNYVAQHLLEHGSPEQQHQLSQVIQKRVQSMCTDYHAVAVVRQALSCGPVSDRAAVSRAVLNEPSLLVSMARSRHGQEAVKHMLQIPAEQERLEAWNVLNESIPELQRSRYGRVVAKHLDSHRPQPSQAGLDAKLQDEQQC